MPLFFLSCSYGIGSQSLTYTGVSVSDPAGTKASSATPAASPAAAAPAAAKGGFCTGCGAANQGGKFCGGCGKPTGGAAASPSPPPAAAAAASSPPPAVSSGSSFAPNRAIQRPGAVAFGAPGASQKCGACNTTVYEAEKVVGGGRTFHQSCFRCAECKTGLNSTNINDKDGKIWCNACYAKKFGQSRAKGDRWEGEGALWLAATVTLPPPAAAAAV